MEYAEGSARPFCTIERSLAHAPDHIRRSINRRRIAGGLQPFRQMEVRSNFGIHPMVRSDAAAALLRLKQAMIGG